MSYAWTPNSYISDSTAANPVVWPQTTTDYVVTVTASGNGCQGEDTVRILVDNRIINLGPDTTLCLGDSVILDVGYPGLTYDWSNGANSQTISVSQGGFYSVTVTGSLASCTDWGGVNVSFKDCNQAFYVPNTFTPNIDGKNDMFYVR